MALSPKNTKSNEGSKGGVRRVNNMPLIMVCAALAICVALIIMVGLNRMSEGRKVGQETVGGESNMASNAMTVVDDMNGIVPETGNDNSVGVVRDPDAPPSPTEAGETRAPGDDPFRSARMEMLKRAIAAKSGMGSGGARSAQRPATQGASAAANDARGAGQATQGSSGNSSSRMPADGQGGGSGGVFHVDNDVAKFDRKDPSDRWYLGADNEPPRTSFELRAGFVIPAILMSGINSELPGQVIGQVSEDVYDSATGMHKLIPQGTRLVGQYNSEVAYGQSRLFVAWQRLVFPDGKAMDIGAMPGSSGAGYGGFGDRVNNHYLRIFGSALLMSGVIAGVNSATNDRSGDPFGSSNNAQISQVIAGQLGDVATQMIRKNMNIAPTLEIRPGYRFNVMVVKDITFKKSYQAFDY